MHRPLVLVASAGLALSFSGLARAQSPAGQVALPAAGRVPESVPTVPVHLEGADGLSLEMQPLRADHSDDVDDDAWRKVCDAPCDRPLPADGIYRVTGVDTSDSDDFKLKAWRDQPIILEVAPTSNAQRRTGTGLIVGGSIVLGIGGLVTTVDALLAATGNNSNGALGVGLGGLVAGAAMLIVGITIHPNTAVKQLPPSALTPVPPPAAPPGYAAPAALRLPAPPATPLYTVTF